MARSVITKGCKTTTGGEVLTGVGNVPLFNTPITQIGTQATCPKCKKGIGTIHPIEKVNFHVDYIQVALEGDIVMCGCPQGTNLVIADKKPMRVSNLPNGHINVFQPFDSGNVDMSAIDEILQRGKYAPTETQQASQAAQAAKTQSAPTVNPQGQHWPPYDYTKPEGEKEIQVEYTSPIVSIGVMSLEEAYEFTQTLYAEHGGRKVSDNFKTYAVGVGKGTYDAIKISRDLGGLGVKTTIKEINGVKWIIIHNFRFHQQAIAAGYKWRSGNPQLIKLGLGLQDIKSLKGFVRVNVGIEVAFAVGINAVDFILRDEATLSEFVGGSAYDIVKAVTALAASTLITSVVLLVTPISGILASGIIFVFVSYAIGNFVSKSFDNIKTDVEKGIIEDTEDYINSLGGYTYHMDEAFGKMIK